MAWILFGWIINKLSTPNYGPSSWRALVLLFTLPSSKEARKACSAHFIPMLKPKAIHAIACSTNIHFLFGLRMFSLSINDVNNVWMLGLFHLSKNQISCCASNYLAASALILVILSLIILVILPSICTPSFSNFANKWSTSSVFLSTSALAPAPLLDPSW